MNRKSPIELKAHCFGIKIEPREDAPNPLITLLVEDDGNWFEGTTFDAAWIDEIIGVLKQAKLLVEPMKNDHA